MQLHRIEDINNIRNKTESLTYVGKSNDVLKALQMIQTKCFAKYINGDRLEVANLAILLVGGMPAGPSSDEEKKKIEKDIADETKNLNKAGIKIMTIGTSDVDLVFLRNLSSPGKINNYFQAPNFLGMANLVLPVLDAVLHIAKSKWILKLHIFL